MVEEPLMDDAEAGEFGGDGGIGVTGTGKAVRSSEAICPPMMRTFRSAVNALISASDRIDTSSAYAVAASSTRRLMPTVAPGVLALGVGRRLSQRPRRVTGVDPKP
ncbi:hypothetical protein GCM10007977_046850 [Dactylosporangium sucinum]|uniref:Uncharacterized protein n=1 Tax=Dactylosporangium sucinum TaxID=1424081 RepID=A0A917WXS6_9ACTN|nr:hypothetical protein GCM10007977_046850 [Dactylosporangium sucinum]